MPPSDEFQPGGTGSGTPPSAPPTAPDTAPATFAAASGAEETPTTELASGERGAGTAIFPPAAATGAAPSAPNEFSTGPVPPPGGTQPPAPDAEPPTGAPAGDPAVSPPVSSPARARRIGLGGLPVARHTGLGGPPAAQPADPALQQRTVAALFLALLGLAGWAGLSNLGRGIYVVLFALVAAGLALWLSVTAITRARRARSAAPRGSVTAVVIASVGVIMSLLMLATLALFGEQVAHYSQCLSGANTISTQQTCQDQFAHSVTRRINSLRGH